MILYIAAFLAIVIAAFIAFIYKIVFLTAVAGGIDVRRDRASEKALKKIRNVLCMGGTSGIGSAVAEAFLRRGTRVVVIGRTRPQKLLSEGGNLIRFVEADLSLITVARATAIELSKEHFDVILCTTTLTPGAFALTDEGIERDLATSYLSRFVVLNEMEARGALKNTRVFIMGYPGVNWAASTLNEMNW
jgi:NAD(P)-dependent dehydrogenase (short-subunit alcohol dehydrogenase family)